MLHAYILPLSCVQGKTGLIIVKTTQALLITHYPDGVTDQQAATAVERLGDYLISVGY